MLIKIVDDDQVFVKKIKDIVYDNFKDIFLDYSIECITSNFEAQYFEKGDIFFLDIDLKEKNGIKIAEEITEIASLRSFSLAFIAAIIAFCNVSNCIIKTSLIKTLLKSIP